MNNAFNLRGDMYSTGEEMDDLLTLHDTSIADFIFSCLKSTDQAQPGKEQDRNLRNICRTEEKRGFL
jgi:hypothetical protein